MTRLYQILILAGAISIALFAVVHISAARFYSGELSTASVYEEVTIDRESYGVDRGKVYQNGVLLRGSVSWDALRLAYAKSLARRSPVFDISGTDPQILDETSDTLALAQESLAQLQTSLHEKEAVRSLYPIGFLKALAEAERRRQAFLLSGENGDNLLYWRSLEEVARVGKNDSENFAAAFDSVLGTTTVRLPGFGGTITQETLRDSIKLLPMRLDEVSRTIAARERCLRTWVMFCEKGALQISALHEEAIGTHEKSRVQVEISKILQETDLGTGAENEIVSSRSTCMGALKGPHHFLLLNPDPKFNPIRYINELFFSDTAAVGPVIAHLRLKFDVTYSLFNPMIFYLCPDIQADAGKVRAAFSMQNAAREYPDIAATAGSRLIASSILHEDDALSYMNDAFSQVLASPRESAAALHSLTDAYNRYRNGGAGLDALVAQIAEINKKNITLAEGGVGYDLTARTLFLTHSAFPSLFLMTNPSAGRSKLHLRETIRENEARDLSAYALTYSVLRERVTREKIIHDIRAIRALDRGLTEPEI